ncbi:MAG TPA: chloride channel protein [Gammaproteobacteria bacterium]|jgi:H+/Cl- antiporter ClcA/CBS domain-containing protein|nr:chloride channel protein [Gammaproteobacteria bacterium]
MLKRMYAAFAPSYSEDGLRLLVISILAAGIGLVAGLAAFVLYKLIAVCTNLVFYHHAGFNLPNIESNPLGLWVIIVPALGGVVVGIMAKYGSDKIRGHGIPEAMEAILLNKSRIAPRVAILKPLSAAIAIGTGGPFGAEGPIIQTGGAIGSLVGQLIRVTAAERKVLLGCGAAAGMAATFSTPIAGVIFAIELMLFEFRSRSFIPLVIATTIATTVHVMMIGPGPMFTVSHVTFDINHGLPFYLLLGIICGYAAILISRSLFWIEDQFEKLPLDQMWWPAIGGLGLGIIGYFFPRVLGVGYGTISDILNNNLPLTILLGIMVFKTLALLISLGSGTSGGLLAPMFMGGAAMGGAFAVIVNQIVPGTHLDPSAFALVGMAAVFAAASRATFTFIIFAFEITRNYESVLPLMLVCVIASGLTQFYMRESIMTEKLARRGLRIHLEYEVDVLRQVKVAEVMDKHPPVLNANSLLTELVDRISRNDLTVARQDAYPLVDEAGILTGIITRGDIFRALENRVDATTTLLAAGTRKPLVAYPDETLHDAAEKMLRRGIGRLPVVDLKSPDRLIGLLGRAAILDARQRRLADESDAETGWIGKPRRNPSNT